MALTWYLWQQGRLDSAGPWQKLGDSEDIGSPVPCLTGGVPTEYFPVRHNRRTPLHESNDPASNKIEFGLLQNVPGSTRRGNTCTISRMIAADEMAGIHVRPDLTVDRNTLQRNKWKIGSFNVANIGPVWPVCGPADSPLEPRNVMPLARVIGWPGWFLRVNIRGHVPRAVGPVGVEPSRYEIFRVMFGLSAVQQRAGREPSNWTELTIGEINTGQELWELDTTGPTPECRSQPFSGFIDLPIFWCDQIIDLWNYNAGDEINGFHPVNGANVPHYRRSSAEIVFTNPRMVLYPGQQDGGIVPEG